MSFHGRDFANVSWLLFTDSQSPVHGACKHYVSMAMSIKGPGISFKIPCGLHKLRQLGPNGLNRKKKNNYLKHKKNLKGIFTECSLQIDAIVHKQEHVNLEL